MSISTRTRTITDPERMEFVLALDAAPFEVSNWEAKFIESILTSNPRVFSARQRIAIDRMIEDYGDRISW